MDSSFTIKPRVGVQANYAQRDHKTGRDAAETELAVRGAGDGGHHQQQQHDPHHDHAPHDVVADPESREVINRENDVRTHANEDPHPDQALLRQRAYRPARHDAEPLAPDEPHANIKA